MRLPGLDTVADGIGKVTRRFPFAMIVALIGTASAYSVVHFESLEDEWSLYRLLMTSVLGFLLFVVLQLKLEREKMKGGYALLIKLIGAVFLALYYWQLPNDFDFASSAFIIRFFLLGLTLLFSLTFVPFIRHVKEVNGFWQYCKTLFIRFFLTFVFTGTLYLGLVLALVGVKELLGINFDEKLFFELWIVIVGLISTSFFLLGIPESTAALQKKTDYHRGIQIFAEYVLTPLILIYAVILYIYTGKIILNWDWPEGMVSWLIIVFSIATILANFMLWPLLKKEVYVKYFQKISYALLIPMTMVMFLALKIRIDDYGITEARYYGMVVCFWFLAMSLYFIFSKKKNLLVLPVSLCIITLLSSAGPISSMNISKWSQMNRLKTALIESGILIDGKVQKIEGEIDKELIATISSSLDYIIEVHGFEVLQPWFDEKLSFSRYDSCYRTECVTRLMGIKYLYQWERGAEAPIEPVRESKHFYVTENSPLRIEGYSEIIPFHISILKEDEGNVVVRENPLRLIYTDSDEKEKTIEFEALLTDLEQNVTELKKWDEMRIDREEIGIAIQSINYQRNPDNTLNEYFFMDGYLLIRD
ncbi:DUF4153 domain-containing protein [Candidatus Peregrinibacteria bacterium]|nr:DUF4153 domain-containing protein [Candidatus Peregrinibacteria bacterium]